jgi:DNA (cytosine-5)-methyltransferase 1
MPRDSRPAFYEFFAGGGMARLGLGPAWACSFANDMDRAKANAYAAQYGDAHLHVGDVWTLNSADLPGAARLAWASFPCQDLSLAGERRGLSAPRSGAFWGFWRLIEALIAEGRAPPILALENVTGLLTSHGGADFQNLCTTLAGAGYRFGALTIDAALFTPQSRPRVFIVATREPIAEALIQDAPGGPFHAGSLPAAVAKLSGSAAAQWVWWRLPAPPLRNTALADLLEPDDAVIWRSDADTQRLISLMSPRQRARLEQEKARGGRRVGAAFRRVRTEDGEKHQRVEARFDDVAGCLRTPAGGSSRQSVIVIDDGIVRSRLLSPRECARLMGLPDDYPLPASASAALHLLGDGVAAPSVRWLSEHLLEPLAHGAKPRAKAA